ncbi:Major Facilitator Superfamily protein [Verrucomicrobium sp. GAS474]|uniref:MFS transporter n=1 Tax=Verrucomicrobium sp. GAS474 TaxID=1882831 RepID=UPI00087BE898|nr:MFS transporter [Verrucomicrobium sp. GAS474]SDT88661.1 Major Facilitator Superfamily protein [Verrucomicrobium sp. GAS474]
MSLPLTETPATPSAAAPHKIWTVGTLTYTSAGLVALFCWLLWGDFAWSMRDRSIPPVIQLLFKKFGASDSLTGLLLLSLPATLGLFMGPIISYKSDRHRGRWGRRIPYLLAPTPFIVLSMVGLAASPRLAPPLAALLGTHSPSLDALTLDLLCVFWTIFEVGCIAAGAVFGALVNDVVPQGLLGRFYALFRAVSLIVGMIFSYWIFGKAEAYFSWIFLGMAAIYGVGFTLMCLKVKEGGYPPPPEPVLPQATVCALTGVKTYFRDCFTNPYYLLCFASGIIGGAAGAPLVFNLFYAKSLGMGMDAYGKYIALTYAFSLALAYPLGWLADRFHPLRVTIGAMALCSLSTLLSGCFVHSAAGFSVALVANGVFMGTFYTAAASVGQRLLPRSKFAELSSAGGVLNSLVSIALPPLVGLILDRSGHDYRSTFFMSAALSAIAVALYLALHRRFMAFGGPDGYIAPE